MQIEKKNISVAVMCQWKCPHFLSIIGRKFLLHLNKKYLYTYIPIRNATYYMTANTSDVEKKSKCNLLTNISICIYMYMYPCPFPIFLDTSALSLLNKTTILVGTQIYKKHTHTHTTKCINTWKWKHCSQAFRGSLNIK